MPRCLISFGANLGDARQTIEQACQLVRHKLGCSLAQCRLSGYYRTPPIGGPSGQPPFVNSVIALETGFNPWEVWQAIRQVEEQMGRIRLQRWEARRIDVDILLHDDHRIWTPQLKIPHPRMCMRRFILLPATEVAGDWIEPVTGRSVGELANNLRGGKGNLLMCAPPASQPQILLEQVARLAMAEWKRAQVAEMAVGNDARTVIPRVSIPVTSDVARWVAWLDSSLLEGVPRASCEADPRHRSPAGAPPGSPLDEADQRVSRRSPWQDVSPQTTPASQSIEWSNLPLDILHVAPQPKLLVCFADDPLGDDVQWEDRHRSLAVQLGMTSGGSRPDRWHLTSARYLLATDDREWAAHELVAALDAMDCPVEPLD